MNLYTCLTPSHESLLQHHFLPSVPPDLDVKIWRFDQPIINRQTNEQSLGMYGKAGFNEACRMKIAYLKRCIQEEIEKGGKPFIFSDVDVRFYSPVAESALQELGNHDIAFQQDRPGGCCTGFMVIRPNLRNISLFDNTLSAMSQLNTEDQIATEVVLRHSTHDWIHLDTKKFWSIGQSVGQTGRSWTPGQPVDPPPKLLMHHANWTRGLNNKNTLLEIVNAKMTANRSML